MNKHKKKNTQTNKNNTKTQQQHTQTKKNKQNMATIRNRTTKQTQ